MPEELSYDMMKENSISLNEISKNAAADLVKYFLSKKYKITHVYIDTVGDPNKY